MDFCISAIVLTGILTAIGFADSISLLI